MKNCGNGEKLLYKQFVGSLWFGIWTVIIQNKKKIIYIAIIMEQKNKKLKLGGPW
jgi:hypothetical protein